MFRKGVLLLFVSFIVHTSALSQSLMWEVFNSSNSDLPENKLKSITMDRDENIWLGTAGDGGVMFDKKNWHVYNESTSGITNNHVDSIAIDLNGNIWFGTGNGVCMFDGDSTWKTFNSENSGLPNDDIYPLAIDRSISSNNHKQDEYNVWIGTYGDGVARFDGKDWKIYKSTNSPLIDDLIRSIAIDRHGNKWIGTLFGGLAKFNGDATWEIYANFNSKLPSNSVYPIVFDKHDNVWIGTEGGLAILKVDNTWEVYKKDDSGLPDNKIYSLAIDKDGVAWIGTVNSGLVRFDHNLAKSDTNAWTVYNTFNSGLPNNEVRGIKIDKQGIIWLASYGGGLVRYNPNGKGWKNTLYDQLEGLDPYKAQPWNINQLAGMIKKYDFVNENQKKIIKGQLNTYLKFNPDNVVALVLSTQLGIKEGAVSDELHEYVDKALSLDPDNAEANFWKGRLFGVKEDVTSGEQVDFIFGNYDESIKYIKKAIAIDKYNIKYRETLAIYLASKRSFEDARIFTKFLDDGNLPIYKLLKDLQMLPLPSGAIFLPDETNNIIQVIKDRGNLEDFPVLRIHAYAVPISALSLETFFEERLPEFDLFEITNDKKARIATYKQYLKIWDKEMYTVNSVLDIPPRPNEGITLDISSIYRKSSNNDPPWASELFKISPTLSERKAFCKMVYVNYR
ncbi:MAG TPA: hypothetical protein EYN89_14395 [Flavobacteriales bacterium]|nr:hypothetical protein [Flavobacteriales bacterium]